MKIKRLIVMITVVFVFFSGQLSAEEVVGESIFPNIETPHPYPKAADDNTLVWSTTIYEPGAAWIKIHFSDFRLNSNDYVLLIDLKGKVIERIDGKEIEWKRHSKFNVKVDDKKRVSFWGPAVGGEKVVVELYRKSNKKRNWGFSIDEVGVGSKPVKQGIKERNGPSGDGIRGLMLFQKGKTWYTCEGALSPNAANHFIPDEPGIDYRDIADTIEVQFTFKYMRSGDSNIYPVYYVYYCDGFVNGGSRDDTGHLKLRNHYDIDSPHPYGQNSNNNVELASLYEVTEDYVSATITNQAALDDWEEDNFIPSLELTATVPTLNDTVLEQEVWVEGPDNNHYSLKIRINKQGQLAVMEAYDVPDNPEGTTAARSHTTAIYWHPICCYSQRIICNFFQSIFWWNLNCTLNYYYCYYQSVYNPCYSCYPWGLSWLFFLLFW